MRLVPSIYSRARTLKIVQVTWLDAYLCGDNSIEAGSLMTSVGVLVRQDRECVKIAMTYDHTVNGDGYRDVLTVPRGMVRDVVVLSTFTRDTNGQLCCPASNK